MQKKRWFYSNEKYHKKNVRFQCIELKINKTSMKNDNILLRLTVIVNKSRALPLIMYIRSRKSLSH